jgi:23S rRNA (guanine745-N1)-methyltransferase
MQTIYICPKCKAPLALAERTAKCAAGHSYDRAKEGYFNLLLTNIGGTHGDNKEMIEARRTFLDAGYYAPLSDALNALILRILPKGGRVLDGGAGEGYYTARLAEVLSAEERESEIYSFDISKDAVRRLAKRRADLHPAVAGVYDMPVASESVDVMLNLFAPFAGAEFLRVLKKDGYLCMAVPEREHLFGLKEKVYENPYYNEVSEEIPEGFSLVESIEIKEVIRITDPLHIRALFAMTPYAYRTGKEGREAVLALDSLETPIHFRLFLYRKK